MQVSVVIPTYYRSKDLDECLDSIVVQTKLPKEILVIDNANDIETGNLIEEKKNEFKEKNIILKYIRNERENSLAIAENIGIEKSTGDIILFLDNDVILDVDYIKEILKVYKEKPNAIGVQGLIQREKEEKKFVGRLIDLLNRLFYIRLDEKNKFRLLPSLGISFPYFVDELINCEWLSGSNNAYKREFIEEFKFDENLKKCSWGEDLDTPYRIFKKYPYSLFMTPYAKLIHKLSPEGRTPKKELIYVREIHKRYLFYKDIDQTFINKLIFLWSAVGSLIMNASISIMSFIIRGSKSGLVTVKYTIDAYVTCMKHLKEIKKGDLEFFNKGLR